MEEWNRPGIQRFVFQTLEDINFGQDPLKTEEMHDLTKLITDMADGVFLWTKAAMDTLVELWSRENLDFSSLLLRLVQPPRDVEKLWDQIRENLDQNQKLEANVLLQLVCSAAKPLTLAEFFEAWQYQDLISLPSWAEGDYSGSTPPVMREAILTLSCGLLEVVTDEDGEERVFLIHKSVQHYLDTRGWWLSDKDDRSLEDLWLKICIASLSTSTWVLDRTLCYQNNKEHKATNPVCKAHGCYKQLPDGNFPSKLIEDLHRLTLGRSRKTSFLKRGDTLSPLLAYVLHRLPYFAWKLESTREQSCAAITNAIMCPEIIYLSTYVQHPSCTACASTPVNEVNELSTRILFHGTNFQIPGLVSRTLREEATLAHYINYHRTHLSILAESIPDSARTQVVSSVDFALTDEAHHDQSNTDIILMGFERAVVAQGIIVQQPLLGSKLTQPKIAVLGSRSVGIASAPLSLAPVPEFGSIVTSMLMATRQRSTRHSVCRRPFC